MQIDNLKLVASRLRQERERLKLTIVEVSSAVGLGKSTIVNYEAAHTSPTVEYLCRLQDLNFDISYVLNGIRQENIFTNEHPDLLWAAVMATEKLKSKKLVEEVSDSFLGMTALKFFRLLLDQTSSTNCTFEGEKSQIKTIQNEIQE